MASRGSKRFFFFLASAFLMVSLAAGLQALVQWQHPSVHGWSEQLASAQEGSWGTWIALGLPAAMGLACLLLAVFSFLQSRRFIGSAAVLFSASLASVPELASPWTLYAAGGSFLLFGLFFMITAALERRVAKTGKTPAKAP